MSRKDQYRENLTDFKKYIDSQILNAASKNAMLEEVNRENEIVMLCDMADALMEISKSLESLRAEVSQIRRQMPR